MPNGHYKQVITDNSPVSNKVLGYIETYKSNLPSGIMNEILDVQLHNNRTITAIERDINGALNERTGTFNEMLLVLLNDTLSGGTVNPISLQQAVDLIENDSITVGNENIQLTIASYLSDGDYETAATVLATMPVYTLQDQDFYDLYSILIGLQSNGKTLWEMTIEQMLKVTEIAERTVHSTATSNANAILRLVQGRQLAYQYPLPNSMSIEGWEDETTTSSPTFLGDNLPNPFGTNTMIPYQIPKDSEGYLMVYTIDGQLLWHSELLTHKGTYMMVDMTGYSQGVYLYSLKVDGVTVDTKKMVKK